MTVSANSSMAASQALPAVLDRIDSDLDESLERLFALLRIQSISTDPAYAPQCRVAAEHVAADLRGLGFDTTVRPTEGHPVVIGYDGSPSSRNALAYAVGMARRRAQPLLVVYVVPFGVYCEPMTGQVICTARERQDFEPWLFTELHQVCDAEGLDVSVMARRGNAAKELAAAADSSSADALVVGASAHKLRHVAGSIPGWLARHARCPVIVVP